jgi:hypothetical protein
MFAHYYGSKARGYFLIINTSASISINDKQIKVDGKKQARKIANEMGAICWNF